MEIVQLTLGALGTNCYLVKREEGVLVIDPAAEPRPGPTGMSWDLA